MIITLYNSPFPTIKLNKDVSQMTLIGTTSASPDPNGPVSLINPVFIVDIDKVSDNANYLYCQEYGRYYFIVDITYTVAKTAIITCHVDVLTTYATRINSTTLNFLSGDSDVNEVEDPSYPLGDYIGTRTKPLTNWAANNFSNNDGGRRYILRVAAGAVQSGSTININVNDYVIYSKWKYQLLGPADDAQFIYIEESYDTTLPRVRNNMYVMVNSQYKYKVKTVGVEPNVPAYLQLDPLF